ncbi:hypothetical protein BG015_000812 [Linnemannia schmuckeri]|uniref:Metallo-beta-lactamase domain-containing protein n=1 Tax=Linnemannia schmuckeri TaxID=64567 RepID=A0A9P5V7H3_9FUNG|nr:hypothetical protein BG015_000812 [Linnemannia schmuckeri]
MTTENENRFPDLVELDALRLTVIVDNEVDFMTSVPRDLGHTTQAQSLFKDHRRLDKDRTTVSSGNDHTHSHAHATEGDKDDASKREMTTVLKCETTRHTGVKDNKEHKVLFDTGPHSAIFLENAKRLEIEFEKIEVIVLSHWHIDHSGGMLAAVERCQQARQQQQQGSASPVVLDLHPDRPDERGICLTRPSPPGSTTHEQSMEYVAWGKDPSFSALESAGGQVSKNAEAHTICESYFGVSGTIPRRTTYETGLPNHVRWSDTSKSWTSEQEIMDERYLVARVRSKGLVVLTGCSHAGVINVCQDVQRAFGAGNEKDNNIFFVVGGFHLAGGSMESRIEETVKDMKEINPSYMAPGHCSGWRAKSALENAMTGKVVSLGVGSDFSITHHHDS